MEEATALVHELLGVGDDWHVLFLSGGASSQFFMTAMNLLGENDKAAYIDTGSWSKKAIKEAKMLGKVDVIASSAEDGYTYIPKEYNVPSDAKYLHITSNNTIFGTQWKRWPEAHCPIVADMSSDIFSRPIDMSKFGLIYAGAQKNIGPAGVTLVIAHKDFLSDLNTGMPTMLNYQTHIDKGSMFNTPPVFPIFVSMLNMRWLKQQGGVEVIAKRNQAKADLIYKAIDENPMFKGVTAVEDRSNMNATFTLEDKAGEQDFLKLCAAANISGVKGHRSVGGFRASMYNAMTLESVEALTQVMHEFAAAHV